MHDKRYRLVIFDWEGTLSDTVGQILNCVALESQRLQFGPFDEALARQSVDLGLVNAVKKVFSHLSVRQHNELLTAVQHELMKRHGETYLMPGAKEIIQRIDNAAILLAIATNKGHQSLQRALASSHLDAYFSTTRSASKTALKPDPLMILQILEELDISADEALMIGDSSADIEMAQRVRMDSIGVNFYHRDEQHLLEAGALVVFDNFQDLALYLQLPELRADI